MTDFFLVATWAAYWLVQNMSRLCAILCLSLAAFCSSPERRDLQPNSPHAEFGRYLSFRGDRFYYIDRGQGDAVVLIHGFGGSGYSFRDVIAPLAQQYRTLTPDLIGFGFSDRPDIDYNIELFADQIIAMLDQLGIARAHVVGNSMGGRVGLYLAQNHAERLQSLVLINAAAYPRQEGDGGRRPWLYRAGALPCVGDALSLFVTRGRVRGILEQVYYDDSRINEADIEAYYAPLQLEDPFRAPRGSLQNFNASAEIQNRIPQIATRTLVLWGRHDPWIPLSNGERLAREISNAKLVVIDDAAHVPQDETPARVIAELNSFFSAAAESAAP